MTTNATEKIKRCLLRDVIGSIENGSRPKGGVGSITHGVLSVGAEHLDGDGGFDFTNARFIPRSFYDALSRGKIAFGDVLVVKDGATTGKVAFVHKDFPYEEAAVNEHVFILRASREKVLPLFLFFYLFSELGQTQIDKNFHGSAQGGINTTFVDNFWIPIPSMEKQQQTVDILLRAQRLKQKREQANRIANKILQAVFLQMFGDPTTNPKKWEILKLDCFIAFITSGSRWWKKYYSDSGAIFVRVQNLKFGTLDLTDIAHVNPPKDAESKRTRIQPNNVLVSITGEVGLAAVAPTNIDEAYVSQHVALIKLKNLMNPHYLAAFINMPTGGQAQLANLKYGQTRPGLNLGQIRSLWIIVPPRDLQDRFEVASRIVQKLQLKQHQSEKELNELLGAFLNKAFKGELVTEVN